MMQALVANGFGYGLMNVPGRNLHAPDGKAINGQHHPLRLGLITMRVERKPRVLSAFEKHCRERVTVP